MSTDTTHAASIETTETDPTETETRPVGMLRDRSDLIAEAARSLEETVEGRTDYDDRTRPWIDRILWGDRSTAVRQHAEVLLQMDQAESLGVLAEAAMKAGARDALAAEMISDAIETAGQSTALALGQVVAQLEKLTGTLDGHRAALVDTAGDLRAEVEHLNDAVGNVESELREVGLAVDRVGTSIDCLDTEAHGRVLAAQDTDYEQNAGRAASHGPLLLGVLTGWGTALTLLTWAWIATTDPQMPEWMAPAGFGAGGAIALVAALLTGTLFGRHLQASEAIPASLAGALYAPPPVDETPDNDDATAPVMWGGGQLAPGTGSGKSGALFSDMMHGSFSPYIEPDFTNDTVRGVWISRVIAGDEEAQFDVEVALLQAGYALDLAERRAEWQARS